MIIYFTATGNSKFVADAGADFLKDEIIDSRLYIKEGKVGKFSSEKPYVFCSPTHGRRLPFIFYDFLRNSYFSGNRDAYFIMTCGNNVGGAEKYIEKLCLEKGLNFKGLLPLVMPENYIAMYKVPDKKKTKAIIDKAIPPLTEGLEKIKDGEEFDHVSPGFFGNFCSGLINYYFRHHIIKSKPFYVKDNCISCGLCVKKCPVNNIKLLNNKPIRGENCTHCMACISTCPVEAIEYGKKSINKPRYTCPKYSGQIKNK